MKKISFRKVFLLIKNNYSINRSLPMILALGICILGAIVGAMPISDIETRYAPRLEAGLAQYSSYHETMKDTYDSMLGIDGVYSSMFMVIIFALALFSVIALMGYMRERSGVDFYHSLAVNRKEIYLANYITAFVNGVLTIVLSQLLGLFFMNLIAKYPTYSFGETLVMQLPTLGCALLYLALFIALAMIAATISGTVFSTIVSYAFINFYIPGTVFTVAAAGGELFNSKLFDYLGHKPHIYPYTSPLIRYIFGVGDSYISFKPISFLFVALGTLLMIALGMWLYTKKRNENSLRPIAFSSLKRPFQYLIAFDIILLGATFFELITNSLAWCVIGGILALLFTFIITNAFFDKSFSGVFKRARHMAFILIATLVLGAVFVADIFGMYKEIKPDIKNIVSANMYFSVNADNGSTHYEFYFDDEVDSPYPTTAIELDSESREKIAETYIYISELLENRVDDWYNKTEEPLKTISVSVSLSCKNDFAGYYENIYLCEGEEGYEEIMALVLELSEKYSHSLQGIDPETEVWEYTEVIKS